MQKQIKNYLNASIIMSVAFILLGLIFIIWPGTSLDVVRWVISICALALGAYMIALDFTRNKGFSPFNGLMLGTLLVILGVIFAINENIMNIFPVILGAWFVVSAVSTCRVTTNLKGTQAYWPSLIAAVLSLVAGIVLIINPWAGSEAMMMFVGIVIVVHATSSLIDFVMIKKNLKTVQKKVKDIIDSIKEGEIK